MKMPKMKIKVYFYHLFVLAVVMLLCFYLMYRDMKRIETNMLMLLDTCTKLESKMLAQDAYFSQQSQYTPFTGQQEAGSGENVEVEVGDDGGDGEEAEAEGEVIVVEDADGVEDSGIEAGSMEEEAKPETKVVIVKQEPDVETGGGDDVLIKGANIDLKTITRKQLQGFKKDELEGFLVLNGMKKVSGHKKNFVDAIMNLAKPFQQASPFIVETDGAEGEVESVDAGDDVVDAVNDALAGLE